MITEYALHRNNISGDFLDGYEGSSYSGVDKSRTMTSKRGHDYPSPKNHGIINPRNGRRFCRAGP